MKKIFYKTQGTCSQFIEVFADDERKIIDVRTIGGCSGNLQGLSMLLKGMPLKEAKEKLRGIRCGMKPTSCPDQMSNAFEMLEKEYEK